MKEFPSHNAEWVEHLPYWKAGRLFPNSKSVKREDIEGGWEMKKAEPPLPPYTNEELGLIVFNRAMTRETAAFADIIGQYTGKLYGQERLVALFKILAFAWQWRNAYGFGSRVWMHSVCAEAVS